MGGGRWLANGDMLATGIVLRQVGWIVNGGAKDGTFYKDLAEFDRSLPHGSFTPVYIEIGD